MGKEGRRKEIMTKKIHSVRLVWWMLGLETSSKGVEQGKIC